MKKKIFISGPISALPIEKARNNFAEAEKMLLKAGYEVINPMRLPHDHDKTWESYMKEDIAELVKCDCIYVLDRRSESMGMRLELNIAKALKIRLLW